MRNDVARQNLAVLMSLVRSCEAVGLHPQDYLADALMRVLGWLTTRVEELLPEQWSAAWARRLRLSWATKVARCWSSSQRSSPTDADSAVQ